MFAVSIPGLRSTALPVFARVEASATPAGLRLRVKTLPAVCRGMELEGAGTDFCVLAGAGRFHRYHQSPAVVDIPQFDEYAYLPGALSGRPGVCGQPAPNRRVYRAGPHQF